MKITVSLLMIVLAGFKIQAGDASPTPNSPATSFKPTWKGDDHDQPVFTSPTNAPAINNWANTNTLPAVAKWSATNLPPMTNWPATNLPPMTNPPALQPPGGK